MTAHLSKRTLTTSVKAQYLESVRFLTFKPANQIKVNLRNFPHGLISLFEKLLSRASLRFSFELELKNIGKLLVKTANVIFGIYFLTIHELNTSSHNIKPEIKRIDKTFVIQLRSDNNTKASWRGTWPLWEQTELWNTLRTSTVLTASSSILYTTPVIPVQDNTSVTLFSMERWLGFFTPLKSR